MKRYAINVDNEQQYYDIYGIYPTYYSKSKLSELPNNISECELSDIPKHILDVLLFNEKYITDFEFWTNECREMNFAHCESIKLTKKKLIFQFIDCSDLDNAIERIQIFSKQIYSILEQNHLIMNNSHKIEIYIDGKEFKNE